MNNKKRYFVFISYSSKDNEDDNKWAEWLQHELDHWHLPADYKGCMPIQDNLREVFRDRDGFSAGKEWDKQVESKLKESQNLIVICSPHAAKSDAVNKEVEIFINQGKEDSIFPFIIEGDSPDDCFPPALKHNKVGGDVNKDGGRDRAFIKVVAGMLGINFDDLYNRYELEKAEQARLEREKREKLQIAQSRFVAEKAEKLMEEGDYYMARRLCCVLFPAPNDPERAYAPEAEAALRHAIEKDVYLFTFHKDVIRSLSFSPDGRYIASTSDDNTICITDVTNGKLLHKLNEHTDNVRMAVFSPNGKMLVSASNDNTVGLWDVSTGECLKMLKKHKDWIRCVAFSQDYKGSLIASASNDNTVTIWDANKKDYLFSLPQHPNRVSHVIFSHDGRKVISVADDAVIRVWNTNSCDKNVELRGHTLIIESVDVSPDGKYIVSTSRDNTIRLWKECVPGIWEHKIIHFDDSHEFVSAKFNSLGELFVSTYSDNDVNIWSLFPHRSLNVIFEQLDNVSIPFNTIARLVISSSEESPVVKDASSVPPLCGNNFSAAFATICFENKIIIASSKKDTVSIKNIDLTLKGKERIANHEREVCSVAYSPDGTRIATASIDKTIGFWDANTLKPLYPPFSDHMDEVYSVAFSFDGNRLVSTSRDNTVRVWDIKSGNSTLIYHLDFFPAIPDYHPSFDYYNAVFSRDGKCLFVACACNILVIDIDSKQIIKTLPQKTAVTAIAVSPVDPELIAFATKNTIKILNLKTSKYGVNNDHWGGIWSIAFSLNGQFLITASEDKTARFFEISNKGNIQSLICRQTFHHSDEIKDAAISHDLKYAVTGSKDKELRVWDIISGVCLKTFRGHSDWVNSVDFNLDGRHIVSSSWDGTIRIWDFPPLQELIDKTRRQFKDNQLAKEERRHFCLE